MKSSVFVFMTATFLCAAAAEISTAQTSHHVVEGLAEAKWGPAPPVLPPGAKIAVLAGDPGKAVPYTVRLQFPAHYQIPAHSHPTDENVVVVSGQLSFGTGAKLKKGAGDTKTLSTGGYGLMPANMNHFAYAGAETTTIVLYGLGPVEFKYVNPADDPRNSKLGTK